MGSLQCLPQCLNLFCGLWELPHSLPVISLLALCQLELVSDACNSRTLVDAPCHQLEHHGDAWNLHSEYLTWQAHLEKKGVRAELRMASSNPVIPFS